MTNYEKIKGMSIEEMAILFDKSGCYFCTERMAVHCYDCEKNSCLENIKQWLRQKAAE